MRALIALREHASFVRVAEQVNLSASAVFCQIRQLEDQLGQKLYERRNKALHLTGTGNLLASFGEKILHMHDSALHGYRSSESRIQVPVRVGCGPCGSVQIVPHMVRELAVQMPKVDVRIISADDNTLLNDLRGGLLDILLMSLPEDVTGLELEHLWTYEFVLVFPRHFQRPRIQDLRSLPFILYRRSPLLDEAYQRLCRSLDCEPDVVMENDEPESIKELIKSGFGASFLPRWQVAEEARSGKLRILRPPSACTCKYGLLYRRGAHRSNATRNAMMIARQWKQWWPLSSYVLPGTIPAVPFHAKAGYSVS